GETVALIGANGAGKTTLMRAVAGAHRPHGGRVVFDGVDITRIPAHRRVALGVALVAAGRRLFPGLAVEGNLRVATSRRRGRSKGDLHARSKSRARGGRRLARPRSGGQGLLRPEATGMTLVNAVLQGIFLGAFYAVLACGLSIMFGVMRIINLAHGDVAVLGAYIVFVIVEHTGVSAFVAFAAALPVM